MAFVDQRVRPLRTTLQPLSAPTKAQAFLPRDTLQSAVLSVVEMSVRPPVCLSQSGNLSKRRNIVKLSRLVVTHYSRFWEYQNVAKNITTPPTGVQNNIGVV